MYLNIGLHIGVMSQCKYLKWQMIKYRPIHKKGHHIKLFNLFIGGTYANIYLFSKTTFVCK